MFRNIYLLFLLFPFLAFAQNEPSRNLSPVAQEIQNAKASGLSFQSSVLFKPLNAKDAEDLSKRNMQVDNAVYFNFEKSQDFDQLSRSTTSLSLEVPVNSANQKLTLDLIEVDIHSRDFITNVNYTPGKHYRGVVRGVENSLVSISVFENEVIGFINQDKKTLTLGKVKGAEKLHVLYNEFEQGWGLDLQCNTDDQNISFDPAAISGASKSFSPDDCIRERFDVDESITNLLGGVSQATNYATGIFNNHKTLYTNDGINVVLSELKIWSNADPAPFILDQYNTLDSYRAETEEYNGDVAYLGFYQGGWGGGVASSIGGICPNDVDDSKAIGGHYGTYNDVPTYSHDVMIISHELGHIFGARHTHACVWNGNNTAIDGCAGFTEGGCSVPGNSPNAGTIMSYCNENDFNEGFHPQVAEAIRDYIASRTCTAACDDDEPTCSDGIQNGDETGVDCGGSCPPCDDPPTCNDGIQNGDETGVDCGGSCPPCDPSCTVTGGTLSGGPFEFCVGDGEEDNIPAGAITLTGNTGPNSQWVVTDDQGNILGLPPLPSAVNFDEAPAGTCLIWHLSYEDDLTGLVVGNNVSDLDGCYDLSNSVVVNRVSGEDCDTTCMENTVMLVLNLDNYPKETSWDIKDESGTVVASSNGHYGDQPNGSTVVEDACLDDGCYTFNIYDHFGDGICCGYGEGSYELLDLDGNVLAQGAEFGSVESTSFCVSDTSPPDVEYCESMGENVDFEWIERVQFASIDNTSGNNQGYGDYTNLSTTIAAGTTVGVTLTPGFSGDTYNEYWRIWIDFNRDGDFNDAGELLGEGNGAGVLTGTSDIPSSATPGETRMRVSMQYFEFPEPCENFFYGEVEDYTVIIGPAFNTKKIDFSETPTKLKGDGQAPGNGLQMSPNPTDKAVSLEYTAREKGKVQISLMSVSGRSVLQKQEQANTGRNIYQLNTQSLPAGVYMVKLNQGKHQVTKRLTITR